MASLSHFGLRMSLRAITQNNETYNEYSYASINFIVMVLLMGLRQQARPAFAALPQEDSAIIGGPTPIDFNRDPFLENEEEQDLDPFFDTRVPFISGTIQIPYEIVP